jgi:branched-chain amino acid aminotransferase
MSTQVYINGQFFNKEDAKVSVFDHGFLYGDGVFEGIRVYAGKCFKLKEHVERLYESARAIWLEIPSSRDKLAADVTATVQKNGIKDGYVRMIVSRGAGALGLDPQKTSNPQIIIIADTIQLYPREFYEKGLPIVTAGTIRNHPAALNPRIKSLNYLNNILAKIEGAQAGCVEALMLNHKGEVAECTGDNIFAVRGNTIRTPDFNSGILEGITRNFVIDIARQSGFDLIECTMTRHDLFIADEVFLTGTAAEMIPVIKIDGRMIGDGKPGPVFKKLHAVFKEEVVK